MSDVGVLVIAHGSIDPKWPELVRESLPLVELGRPAALGFLEEVPEQTIQHAVDQLEEAAVKHIIAVPLFISSASVDAEEARFLLGLTDNFPKEGERPARIRVQTPITWTQAIDDAPVIGRALADRALELTDDPQCDALVVVGHGSYRAERVATWERNLTKLAETAARHAGFKETAVGLLTPPTLLDAVAGLRGRVRRVVVIPAMLASGYFTGKVAQTLQGLEKVSDVRFEEQALLPHPNVFQWVKDQVDSVFDKVLSGR